MTQETAQEGPRHNQMIMGGPLRRDSRLDDMECSVEQTVDHIERIQQLRKSDGADWNFQVVTKPDRDSV